MTIKKCPICNGPGEKERQVGKYWLSKCHDCGFVYADVSDEQIEQVNFNFGDSVKHHYCEVQSSIDALWFERISSNLTQGKKGLKVLDIGCGNGLLLRQFQKRGCVCFGSDPSPWAQEYAQKYGYTLLPRIEEAGLAPNSFDIITATSTLEHVARPIEHLKYIMAAVKEGGMIYLTVPNYGSLPIRLRLVKGRLVDPPGHCNYFTAKTLKNLFMQKGIKEYISYTRVRSYGIPEIHAVYRLLSKKIPTSVKSSHDSMPKRILLKRALINIYYWSGMPFGFGDKLEAWIVKNSAFPHQVFIA
ncbi:MAG: methyltransferase domain-containing protein [Sedimentisphaerales bacterium]|nr:methyltransferase domain-containing protein [Sedimentisphaerales bacterium]